MNTIEEIIASGQNITIAVKGADLKRFGEVLMKQARERAIDELKSSILLAPLDVMAAMKISRTTLHRMDKAGILKPIQFYGDNRYRLSDVEELLAKQTKTK